MAEETLRFGSGRDALRSEDEPLLDRARALHRRSRAGGRRARGVRARADRPRRDPVGGRRGRGEAAGRRRDLHRRRSRARRDRRDPARGPPPRAWRQADVRRVDAGARGGARALRRRAGRDRRRGDRGAGAGRRGGGGARTGRPAGRIGRRARGRGRRAGDLGRGAGQRLPRLGGRQRAGGRGRVRERRARRARAAARHPRSGRSDGAARRDRRVGRGVRTLHADRRHAGRGARAEDARRVGVQGAAAADPRAHARRRRRLRHEGAGVSGVRRGPLRGAARRPHGQVARLAARELPRRHARPRRAARRRARARRRRKVPRAPRAHHGRHRRVHLDLLGGDRDQQHEELPVERVRDPGDPHRREDDLHERDAARAVPRRRPAGGDLPHRAADRRRVARDRHRPRDVAPEESDPALRDAVQGAELTRLRQRRVRSGARQGARARRLERVRGAARGVGARREAARAGDLLLPRGRGREPAAGHRGSALRGGRQGRAPARRAGDRAGASHDLSAGGRAAARHPGERGAARAGRQRRGARRPADGRVALDDDGRRLDGDRLRPGDREGAADRRPALRGVRRGHRVRAAGSFA